MVKTTQDDLPSRILATRSLFGGLLMGLANLVPGISGGTMLLVAGVYTQFIEALADLTRMKFKFRSLLVLGCIIVAAGLGILLFAGTVKDLVVGHRWMMYSLFIGLTLGGLPVVWHLARPATPGLILAAFLAFALMVGLALLQAYEVMGSGSTNFFMLLLAGLAGASAMILPGLSGGYLLLLMGQYVPILSAIDRFKEAIKATGSGDRARPRFVGIVASGRRRRGGRGSGGQPPQMATRAFSQTDIRRLDWIAIRISRRFVAIPRRLDARSRQFG